MAAALWQVHPSPSLPQLSQQLNHSTTSLLSLQRFQMFPEPHRLPSLVGSRGVSEPRIIREGRWCSPTLGKCCCTSVGLCHRLQRHSVVSSLAICLPNLSFWGLCANLKRAGKAEGANLDVDMDVFEGRSCKERTQLFCRADLELLGFLYSLFEQDLWSHRLWVAIFGQYYVCKVHLNDIFQKLPTLGRTLKAGIHCLKQVCWPEPSVKTLPA